MQLGTSSFKVFSGQAMPIGVFIVTEFVTQMAIIPIDYILKCV